MKRVIGFLLIILILSGVILLSNWNNNERNLSDFSIFFNGTPNKFLNKKMVNKILTQNILSDKNFKKDMLDLDELELSLKRNPVIKNAEVYLLPDGIIGVEIEERKPIIRIVSDGGYYLDETGNIIPLSKKYSPKLPVFKGQINNNKLLVDFFKKISKNNFVRNEIVEINYLNGDFKVRLKSYKFEIEFGKFNSMEQKIYKLISFCKYINFENKFGVYQKINLKYNNQVVAIS
ncbi:MAG: hypothetical protein P8M03_01305 [Flavobacteriaceae bacterium]|nr:hypothetical protein [Flavobacteriaceae bacterium]